jgi:hypothetical protein
LQFAFSSLDLSHLLEGQMDDLSALPDGVDAEVETDCGEMHIADEKHYVDLILQNLHEDAQRYNRPGGRIRISCREEDGWAILTGNTGRSISGSRTHLRALPSRFAGGRRSGAWPRPEPGSGTDAFAWR